MTNTATAPAAIATYDVTDWSEVERPDMSTPYAVAGAPYGESMVRFFATEAEARRFAADIAAMAGERYNTSWGLEDVNTATTITLYVVSADAPAPAPAPAPAYTVCTITGTNHQGEPVTIREDMTTPWAADVVAVILRTMAAYGATPTVTYA